MVTVNVYRATSPPGPSLTATGHPKAILDAERGTKLVLPFAPRAIDLSGLADTWERVDRPGRRPLTLRTGRRLPALSLPLVLARSDQQASVEDLIAALLKLGEAEERVTLSNMSPAARGPWRIADLTITSSALQYGTNYITRATANLSLVAASDALPRRGPLSGGKSSGATTDARRYTVKAGDTLRKLADRFYGSPGKWQIIAKANGIKSPGADLKPGRVLRIPAKK